jgi:hypothetical protein
LAYLSIYQAYIVSTCDLITLDTNNA